jgi:predicted RNA-binding protein Jag
MESIKREIREYLDSLLSILEEEVSFDIEGDTCEDLYVNLTGSLFSLPEERPILTSLEHLLRGKTGKECEVVVDVNGGIRQRRAELIRFALSAAESARSEHKRIRLNPMPSHERRTVHITLANFPGVKTYSVDDGDKRRVVIEPDGA